MRWLLLLPLLAAGSSSVEPSIADIRARRDAIDARGASLTWHNRRYDDPLLGKKEFAAGYEGNVLAKLVSSLSREDQGSHRAELYFDGSGRLVYVREFRDDATIPVEDFYPVAGVPDVEGLERLARWKPATEPRSQTDPRISKIRGSCDALTPRLSALRKIGNEKLGKCRSCSTAAIWLDGANVTKAVREERSPQGTRSTVEAWFGSQSRDVPSLVVARRVRDGAPPVESHYYFDGEKMILWKMGAEEMSPDDPLWALTEAEVKGAVGAIADEARAPR